MYVYTVTTLILSDTPDSTQRFTSTVRQTIPPSTLTPRIRMLALYIRRRFHSSPNLADTPLSTHLYHAQNKENSQIRAIGSIMN